MKIYKILKNLGNKTDRIYFVFLFALVILLKLPTMNLDYYWDALTFAGQAKYLSINGLLTTPPGYMIHVPFFTWFLAINYKIFSESPFLSHFIIAIFSFLGAYFTYLLGKFLFNEKVGIISSLLLFFSPIYFAISGQVLFDVPLTAMTVITLYFALKKKLFLYLVSASILVLIKEPGFIAVISLLFYQFIKKEKCRNILYHAVPLLFLLIWETWTWLKTGSFLLGSGTFTPYQGFLFILVRGITNIYQIFFWNYNWILSIFLIITFSHHYFNKKKIPIQTIPLFLTGLIYWILFTFAPVPLLPRYLLAVAPIFFIFSAYSINFYFKNKVFVIFLIVAILFISCYRWNSGFKGIIQDPILHSKIFYPKSLTSIKNGELSLDYIDIVKLEDEALYYIFNNHPNSVVIASFPLTDDANLQVDVGYRQWKKFNITVLQSSKENIAKSDLIVYESCCIPDYVVNNTSRIELIKKFEKKGEYVFIYKPIKK